MLGKFYLLKNSLHLLKALSMKRAQKYNFHITNISQAFFPSILHYGVFDYKSWWRLCSVFTRKVNTHRTISLNLYFLIIVVKCSRICIVNAIFILHCNVACQHFLVPAHHYPTLPHDRHIWSTLHEIRIWSQLLARYWRETLAWNVLEPISNQQYSRAFYQKTMFFFLYGYT